MYTTKKIKCDKNPELDMLAHESGRVYCFLSQGICVCVANAIIQSYFDSLKTRCVGYKIVLLMVLSDCLTAKVMVPIILKSDVKPVYVEMYFQRGSYYFSLVYKVHTPPKRETGKVVAIDMGEIHPIVFT